MLLLQPAVALAMSFLLAQIPRDGAMRARLRRWLWLPVAAWAALIAWWALHFDEADPAPEWTSLVLWYGGPILVGVATLIAAFLTMRKWTWFYVAPFLLTVCVFAAYTWLMAYMSLRHSWL